MKNKKFTGKSREKFILKFCRGVFFKFKISSIDLSIDLKKTTKVMNHTGYPQRIRSFDAIFLDGVWRKEYC